MIHTLLNILRLPENSNLFRNNEALVGVGNSNSVIPQNLFYKESTKKLEKKLYRIFFQMTLEVKTDKSGL